MRSQRHVQTVRVIPFGLALRGLLMMALHDGSAAESAQSERDNEVSGSFGSNGTGCPP